MSTQIGREDTIGGTDVYVSEPESKSTAKSIVFITDIFGWKFKNVRLLADNYAKAGFYCYIPDVREQAGIIDKTKGTVDVMATLGPWLAKHREGVSEPIISGFINTVRQIPGTQKVGAIGFCWGGRYAILQAHSPREEGNVGGVDAAYACHPSLLSVPSDFEKVNKPLSIAVGTKDSLMDQKTNEQIKTYLDTERKDVPTDIRYYEDQVHGFALRGDWSSDKDKRAMDDAEKQGIQFFNKYLA
ncbi:Protein AIM2 [Cyphellophora attinorum]|uniref:Protein AIM2 n=1 Tax=Cyphellophora attinorum TaxID=1664694 RepID=A0A0N1H4Y4_9EURO|nr:Protein AIM2 [Phialophora attinorum]KPI37253.1 Protein AIM2 [Phialophora attinorum]